MSQEYLVNLQHAEERSHKVMAHSNEEAVEKAEKRAFETTGKEWEAVSIHKRSEDDDFWEHIASVEIHWSQGF
jgi:hypothetical protein